MAANIERLNVNVGGVPTAGFAGDDAALRALERASGVTLPESYARFIRQVDGGHPEVGTFVVGGAESEDQFDVDWFYSVANPAVERLSTVLESWRLVLGAGALPIARDGGGNQIFLRASPDAPAAEPAVWLYVHDASEPERRVADSFGTFIDGLHENPDFV